MADSPQNSRFLPILKLAKQGHFEELVRWASVVQDLDLAQVFERAVTDFRTVRRNPGHQRILEWCIERGLDPAARAGWLNQPVVCLAAAAGNQEFVALLARHGLPPDPFLRAAVGDVEFLSSYASRNRLSDLRDENGFTPLFYGAQSGLGRRDEASAARLTEVCRLMLDRAVRPDDEVGSSFPISPAFLCRSSGGNAEVMRLLLLAGGLRSNRAQQALEHALEPHQRSGEPFYQIAGLIVEHGFDLNDRQGQGRIVLHGAADRGTIKAVPWLLEHGADPNVRADQGKTPLHACAERNTSISVIRLLLAAGADPNAEDSSGRTPLDCAREYDRTQLVDYLSSHRAK